MSRSKIFVLLPDGISLKNFAYTSFNEIASSNEIDLIYWNATPFSLKKLGFNECLLKNIKLHTLTDIYKNVRKHIELNTYKKKFNDSVYDTYKFPFSSKSIKNKLKSLFTKTLIRLNDSQKGLKKVRYKIKSLERRTKYYKECYKTLNKEQPKVVFCTNQRPSIAIAPILAAKDLNIPTVTFIFSWDNLPKATMVIETDYYFVWSEHMKQELLKYYSYVQEQQVFVTGTPQFENHINSFYSNDEKEAFFRDYGLDMEKRYICYSGDDITTCPDDPQYLNDFTKAIVELNKKGQNLGIIFRRCPVDFSNRYDKVLQKYEDIIVPIAPKWKKISSTWNTILPTRDDLELQSNTIRYTEMVVNLGSSMVFDYSIYNKPCAFINYDVPNKLIPSWSVDKIYNYVHFRSMPNNKSVIWFNNIEEIAAKLEKALDKNNPYNAQEWFKIINLHPLDKASSNIVKAIKHIIK